MSKLRNLNEIIPPEFLEAEAQSADLYFGKPLVFYGVRSITGSNGAYKRITVSLPDAEDKFVIACGAAQVIAVMDWAAEGNQFPFLGQFVQAGRAIILKGVE